MKQFGLIGFPLSHSFSQKYFSNKFLNEKLSDCEYLNFEIENISEISRIVDERPNLVGLNVTIPYKQSVLKFIDELDHKIQLIGSINTIKIIRKNNKTILQGFNTDVIGLEMALKPMLRSHHTRALILGNGGSSKAVQFVLKELGIDFLIVTRTPKTKNEIGYQDLNESYIRFHPLIINTTPVGMSPKTNISPEIPYQFLTDQHFLFDLIYNPEKTLFLQKGGEKGAMLSNGMTMLIQQAEASWKIWNEK